MIRVCISIVVFNNAESTKECLDSLEQCGIEGISGTIILVDNASKIPFVLEQKRNTQFTYTLIRNEENTGFSGGHNTAIRSIDFDAFDYFLVLNNDTIVDKRVIRSLVATAEAQKHVGVLSPKIYFYKGSEYHKERYTEKEKGSVLWYAGGIIDWENMYESHRGVDEVDHGQYDVSEETDFATGCCMIVKKDVLKRVGLFDERYFLYKEDVDLSMRIRKAGYTILYEPKAFLWHKNAESTGGSGSPMQDYYTTRNRLLLGFQYAPFRTRVALLRESVRLFTGGRKGQRSGIKDFYLRRFGRGSYPV